MLGYPGQAEIRLGGGCKETHRGVVSDIAVVEAACSRPVARRLIRGTSPTLRRQADAGLGGMRCRYGRMDTAHRKAAENQQRFSLGTKFHCALQGATELAAPDSAMSDLCAAVRILGAAVEAELSNSP